MLYDVFISHASEDKDEFVRLLAARIKARRIEVWYDEFSLKLGDSLRQSIDKGLSKSRYGIVVLSKAFFKKDWTNWELDGLVARQMNHSEGNNLIIPIWHNISKEDITGYSPSLADKVAINSSEDLDNIVNKIEDVLNPKGSTLLIARDYLIRKGIDPPIVTDDWWLDMLEYCGKEYLYHEYLSFPIAWVNELPESRGVYIAKHILQKLWQDEAEEELLSQLSNPEDVWRFIEENPGMREACMEYPEEVAFYFPQLTIRQFSKYLGDPFDAYMQKGMKNAQEDEFLLRQSVLDSKNASHIACFYFTGAGGGVGRSSRRHDLIDCVLWLLSSRSQWLPDEVRRLLIKGMKEWTAWHWEGNSSSSEFEGTDKTGTFLSDLYDIAVEKVKDISETGMQDLQERFQYGIDGLRLEEDLETITSRFFETGFADAYISRYRERIKKNETSNL